MLWEKLIRLVSFARTSLSSVYGQMIRNQVCRIVLSNFLLSCLDSSRFLDDQFCFSSMCFTNLMLGLLRVHAHAWYNMLLVRISLESAYQQNRWGQISACSMDWFNKIFKGSSPKISERHWHGDDEDEQDSRNPSSAGDTISDEENEDVDHAIVLSILEANQNRQTLIDRESQLEEDEELARAIQESLNLERAPQVESISPPALPGNGHIPPIYGNSYFSPGYGSGNPYQPFPMYATTGYRICAGCNSEIGQGRFLSCMNAVWHPECFRCNACNIPISDYEFSMSGNFPYHKSCYKEHYHPKCDVCRQFIPTNPAGLIEYRAHPFWSQKYCPSHEHDGTPRCCSCERMEPRETKYVPLGDGRKLCLECLDSAVLDTNECQPLYSEIQKFYESLNMKVEQQVPLLLVERQALNEAREGEKNGHHHMPETRGLCLSEEQTISTVRRRPATGGDRMMGMMTEPYKLTRHCEVTAILILFGLPRLLTGSILAHEVMHAWLRVQGYPTLRPDVEEGICQVLARLWLEMELLSGSGNRIQFASLTSSSRTSARTTRSQFEMKLGEFFKHQIESDASPVYGDGFRAGQMAVQKYGLECTLNHIRMTGNFPF